MKIVKIHNGITNYQGRLNLRSSILLFLITYIIFSLIMKMLNELILYINFIMFCNYIMLNNAQILVQIFGLN